MFASTLRRVAVFACFAGVVLLAPSGVFAAGGDQLWVAHYNGPAAANDSGTLLAMSPDGSKVYVAGFSKGVGTKNDFVTIAYNASTGARLWAKRFDGAAHNNDVPHGLAVSPSGLSVFVTGESAVSTGGLQYATVAYSAATGTRRWVQLYRPTAKYNHYASAIAVSPNGSRVYVTGASGATTNGVGAYDIVTIAYSASTGTRAWANRYAHTANEGVAPTAIAVSPNGATVFVTGDAPLFPDVLTTIAYDAAAGTRRWVRRDAAGDYAHALAVAPDGSRIYVAGRGWNEATTSDDYTTVAYAASTGGTVWLQRYDGGFNNGFQQGEDEALALVSSPDGTKVFVTGASQFTDDCNRTATVAYAAADGGPQWATMYTPPQPITGCASSEGDAIAASPDSGQVFITGSLHGAATIAYATSDGGQQWLRTFQSSGGNTIGVSPDNLRVFITGGKLYSGHFDVATIGYRTR